MFVKPLDIRSYGSFMLHFCVVCGADFECDGCLADLDIQTICKRCRLISYEESQEDPS